MLIEILGARYCHKLNIREISNSVSQTFSVKVVFRDIILDFGLTFDDHRFQYNSSIILSLIKNHNLINPDSKTIVLTDLDLFVPILTYVFGEAEFKGNTAVVSSHRLHPEYYGLPRNDKILQERTEKELIHELGHTFGLIHCPDDTCVMHSSTYVEDIDLKGVRFCMSCKKYILNI